jgi:hypothetical protein
LKTIICIALLVIILGGCSYGNIDDIKQHAPTVWKQAGFEIVGYEGYQVWFGLPYTSYGSAQVWYLVKRIPDNGVTYHGWIQKWGKEYHIYELKALDAIKP